MKLIFNGTALFNLDNNRVISEDFYPDFQVLLEKFVNQPFELSPEKLDGYDEFILNHNYTGRFICEYMYKDIRVTICKSKLIELGLIYDNFYIKFL